MNSLITPPEEGAVLKALQELKQLDLLDENEKLTPLGRTLAKFQLEPCLAKVILLFMSFSSLYLLSNHLGHGKQRGIQMYYSYCGYCDPICLRNRNIRLNVFD